MGLLLLGNEISRDRLTPPSEHTIDRQLSRLTWKSKFPHLLKNGYNK